MGKKELKVAFLLALRSLQRGSRSSVILTILIIGMCFTNMIFLPSMFNGIGQSITKQIVDYEVSNVLVSPKSGDQYITDMGATLALINGMPGVQRAAPQYSQGATFKYRQRVLGVNVRAITPADEKEVSPLYTRMVAGSYLGEGDTGEVIIGRPIAGDSSVRQEDEFQPSLGGVRVGDSITVKAKPGYSEKFIKDELLAYGVGVTGKVQTPADLLSKSMGRALQSFAIINIVSLVVSIIITTVVLFIVITIKTISSRKQIGILKAIGVDKEVIMHNYGFQVIILGILGILLGIILTLILAAYMAVHPIVTPEWSATLYLTPMDLLVNSVILFIAAIVAGYVPAYQISREDIQTAMRT